MTNYDLLTAIGDAQDKYILHAAPKEAVRHLPHLSRKLLIAAILILLLLTACATIYAADLFAVFFQSSPGQKLNDGQLDYIRNNTQPTVAQPLSSPDETGYSVNIRSALTDGIVAYITVDITAPEDVVLAGGNIRFVDNPQLYPTPADGLVLDADGAVPNAVDEYVTLDSGKPNAVSLLFTVYPFTENASVKPFDGSIRWRLHIGDFEKSTFDPAAMTFGHTPLGQGNWEFDLTFETIETRELEFVPSPIPIKTSVWLAEEYQNANQLLSLVLSGLNYRIAVANPDVDGQIQDMGDVTIVMRDGTRQTLLRVVPQSAPLNAPIVLDEVDYVLLSDGSKLYRTDAVQADESRMAYHELPPPSPTSPIMEDPYQDYASIPMPVLEGGKTVFLRLLLPEGCRWEDTGHDGAIFYRGDTPVGGYLTAHFEKGILPAVHENQQLILDKLKEFASDQIDLTDFQGEIADEGYITAAYTRAEKTYTFFIQPSGMVGIQYVLWADTSLLEPQEVENIQFPFFMSTNE